MLVGLLVHLVTCGYVLPTIRTMHSLFDRNHVDVSIARHFVTEVSNITPETGINSGFLKLTVGWICHLG